MSEVTLEIPNLDTMAPEELEALGKVFAGLERYARLKALAMRRRLAGHTSAAWETEARCDRIYRQLPKEYRW